MTSQGDEFDYVVVGAGSAGCVVAARLSESGKHRVALLEAGGEDDSFWIHTPLGFGKLYKDPKYNWRYQGEPESALNGARSYQPRGKVLGGTGSINGLTYIRGQREDFEYWRELGNTGWGYDDVLPFFKKSENNRRGAGFYHGAGGPMTIADAPRHRLAEAFIAAGEQAGYARNEDFNGATQDGFGYDQETNRNGRRCSTAVAYLRSARRRSNLTVITHALATRILFRDGEAAGVVFDHAGGSSTIWARQETVLALGTFASPQLLQLSGVGPVKLLRDLGIAVVSDQPSVGVDMQDHFNVAMTFRCTQPITISDAVHNPLRRWAMGLNYLLLRRGLMASNANGGNGFIRTDPALSAPDVKLRLRLWSEDTAGQMAGALGLDKFSGFTVSFSLIHPDNRGTVRLRSVDPASPPELRFNFFHSERDHQTALKALRIIRRLMSMPAMAPFVAEEVAPGPASETDEALLGHCRRHGTSGLHATSTCRMGIDREAVVDPRLRVRGVGRLRVVDASIMPRIVGGNTNAATVMIAEKGAAMILEDAA